jgi:uncharacterized OB-fold protein
MAYARAVMSIYDRPMWESIRARSWSLQKCDDCSKFRYPPAPNCPHCLCLGSQWVPLAGAGEILSWVVFHREYLPEFKPPYNVVTVQLQEGPIVVSNLVGPEPQGNWIGRQVTICYEDDAAGNLMPKMQLVQS